MQENSVTLQDCSRCFFSWNCLLPVQYVMPCLFLYRWSMHIWQCLCKNTTNPMLVKALLLTPMQWLPSGRKNLEKYRYVPDVNDFAFCKYCKYAFFKQQGFSIFCDCFQIDPAAHDVIVGIVNENHHWMLVVRGALHNSCYSHFTWSFWLCLHTLSYY